jgi:abequosyltransferase
VNAIMSAADVLSLPLLTIAVPTYNRAGDLARLLATLRRELAGHEHRVRVIVADNASTDGTAAVVDQAVALWPDIHVVRQLENVGMDGNFSACAQAVDTDFFWVMGDDDLPVPGAIVALLDMLDRERPDLVFVSSRWLRDITTVADEPVAMPLRFQRLSQDAFGRRMHVWATFLTGMIARRSAVLGNAETLHHFSGTHLTQLSWVMERLREGERFIHVQTPCVLATAGNTGGYSVVRVFGDHFPRLVREALAQTSAQRRLARQMILRMMLHFLPGMLWDLRHARLGNFRPENVEQALRPQLGAHPVTRLILLPISRLPLPAARLMLKVASVLARTVSLCDRLRMRRPSVS